MEWYPLPETVCRMDAASERTWTYLQRVLGDGFQFMSRIKVNQAKLATSIFTDIAFYINGTAVIIRDEFR